MEAAGLAIGVPGLAALFLQAGLKGYQVLTEARNFSDEADHYMHGIKVEHQRLLDWNNTYAKMLGSLEITDQQRCLLIANTLARIALLFTSVSEMADKYAHGFGRENNDQRLSPKQSSTKRLLRPSKPSWFRRSRPNTPDGHDTENLRPPTPSSPLFDMEAIIPDDMKRDQLALLGIRVEKSEISVRSIKWALFDKKRLEELHQRLKGYTQNLVDISVPLLAISVSPDPKTTDRLFMIPFPRNQSYVDRGNIFDRLDELLDVSEGTQSRAALWALGGMGKTTSAAEYCYRKSQSEYSIFWVHGNSDETFQASYRDIYKRAGVPAPVGADMDELQWAVKHWLESPESGNWIMVIDNLDDLDVDPKYIPSRRGAILFTTRDRRILGDSRFGVPVNAGVELEQMSLEEAAKMCQNLGMNKCETSSSQAELLELLGNLPLAIAQAAAYMRSAHVSTQEYLELFKASENEKAELLDQPLHGRTGPNDDVNSTRTVKRTWAVTITKIQTEDSLAVEMLQFLSVIDPESVAKELILKFPAKKTISRIRLERCIGLLLNFALISKVDSSHYRMHRLVSFCTRISMQKEQRFRVLHETTELLLQSLPNDIQADLFACSQLLPHATILLMHCEASDIYFDDIGSLQTRAATVFTSQGEHEKALEWYQRALVNREQHLGKDHLDTLVTANFLVLVFNRQGKYEKALELCQRVLEVREKCLGEDHHDTLTAVHNMGLIFDSQRQYEKALEWYQRALDGTEKCLGKENIHTLTTVHCMASVFENMDQYEKALKWCQRALDGEEKCQGKDHPDTLSTVHRMASILKQQREYEKALEWYQRALEGREKSLGKNHPDTLCTVHAIASAFYDQGQYEKALEWHQRTLERREETLGKDHPDTLASIQSIGMVFDKQDQYEKALEWSKRALEGREKSLGRDNPETLVTVHNIGLVLEHQREYKKALEWYQRALDGREERLGINHRDTLTTVYNMALVFRYQGEHEKALEWYQRALDDDERCLGKDHPTTLSTVHSIASVYKAQGQYDKALEWYQRTLDGRVKCLGNDHPDTLRTARYVGDVQHILMKNQCVVDEE